MCYSGTKSSFVSEKHMTRRCCCSGQKYPRTGNSWWSWGKRSNSISELNMTNRYFLPKHSYYLCTTYSMYCWGTAGKLWSDLSRAHMLCYLSSNPLSMCCKLSKWFHFGIVGSSVGSCRIYRDWNMFLQGKIPHRVYSKKHSNFKTALHWLVAETQLHQKRDWCWY